MSRRRRGLNPEDRALWEKVVADAVPLRPAKLRPPQGPVAEAGADMPPRPAPAPRPPEVAQKPPAFRIGETATALPPRRDLAPSPAERIAAQPVVMDRKTHRALGRGKLKPEARLDLHGMTLAEAHPALTRFLLGSHGQGRRLVLVITGKGRGDYGPLPTRPGALRHQVPHWLALPPLAAIVMQIAPAHIRHGGEGAYYVYLRRA